MAGPRSTLEGVFLRVPHAWRRFALIVAVVALTFVQGPLIIAISPLPEVPPPPTPTCPEEEPRCEALRPESPDGWEEVLAREARRLELLEEDRERVMESAARVAEEQRVAWGVFGVGLFLALALGGWLALRILPKVHLGVEAHRITLGRRVVPVDRIREVVWSGRPHATLDDGSVVRSPRVRLDTDQVEAMQTATRRALEARDRRDPEDETARRAVESLRT